MPTERTQALPQSVIALRALRRTLSAAAIIAAGLGALASADAILSGFGSSKLSIAAAQSTVLTGSMPADHANRGMQVRIEPSDGGLIASDVRVSKAFISSRMNWSALLTADPDAAGKHFTVIAGTPDKQPHELDIWRVDVLSDAAAVRAASSSLVMRLLGLDALNAALGAFICALSACVLYFTLIYFSAAWLAKRGFVRVYHTRMEGDDTMLYCIDPQSSLRELGTYPILSATGKLLGMAQVITRGTRYCVLQLTAAQARTGCLVALPMDNEADGL